MFEIIVECMILAVVIVLSIGAVLINKIDSKENDEKIKD